MGTTNRFDIRDDIEGGGVIIWLNDLEKDSRYKPWPTDIQNVLFQVVVEGELTLDDASFVSRTVTYYSEEYTSRGVCPRLVEEGGPKSSCRRNGHVGQTIDPHSIRYCGVTW